MGIRGLTSYVQHKEEKFLQSCQLHDCNVVIDGSGLSNLHNSNFHTWDTEFSSDCYGGDFDKFGDIIEKFFRLLKCCNITPYIVFYGPTEDFKIDEKMADLIEKVERVKRLTPNLIRRVLDNSSSRHIPSNFDLNCPVPAGIKYVPEDIAKEFKLNIFASNSKVGAANEMACLAKQLNCPVMSMNSDFYLYGADYIPFQSIAGKPLFFGSYKYLSCKVFKFANLIRFLRGAPKTEYLLPVLLGNKIIDSDYLDHFYSRIKPQRYLKKAVVIFDWIRRQRSLQSAIREILNSYDKSERVTIYKKMKAAMMIYMPISVDHIKDHFGLDTSGNGGYRIDFNKLENDLGFTIEEEDSEQDETVPLATELFLRKYHKCDYPAFFLFMLRENKYYIYRDVEDFDDSDANELAFSIMAAIHKTLIQNDNQQLTVLMRNAELNLEKFEVPLCPIDVPSIEVIEGLSVEERQPIILDILGISDEFLDVIKQFPDEWHLLLLTLKYFALNKKVLPSPYAYSFVLCFVLLNYVMVRRVPEQPQIKVNFSGLSMMIPILMNKLKNDGRFKIHPRENDETFDRSIIHVTSELKCIFIHLKFLNALYNFAFKDAFLHEIFDGTFIYNMTVWFQEQPDMRESMAELIEGHDEDEEAFLTAFRFVIRMLEEQDIV